MRSRSTILADALLLPPEERAQLAKHLIDSLDSPEEEGSVEAAWLAEVERRLEEVDRGSARLEPWEVVRDRIAARLRTLHT